jgi:DUF4097 and DUF4098 domain-containing protein YvlB
MLVALAGASIFASAQLFIANGPVPPGHFSYLQNVPATGGSLMINNINGQVTISAWSGNQALINGTISPNGVGATPDQVNLQITNSYGLTISATYPTASNDRSYTVDLGVFVPSTSNLTTLGVSLTSGRVQLSNLQVSHLSIYTASGSVSATVHAITPTGSYAFSTDTGSINLDVPSMKAFTLTATTDFAHVWASGLNNCQVTVSEWNTFIHVGQIVTANCGGAEPTFDASTHNGDITINRT